MSIVRNSLLNGLAHPVIGYVPASGEEFYTPTFMRHSDDVVTTYKIHIEKVVGAPSGGFIQFRFDGLITTTGGGSETPPAGVGIYPPTGDQWYWSDLRPKWERLNEIEHRHRLPDGDFRAYSAGVSDTLPKTVFRSVRGDHRLAIKPTLTGGTNPAFILSIETLTRYPS